MRALGLFHRTLWQTDKTTPPRVVDIFASFFSASVSRERFSSCSVCHRLEEPVEHWEMTTEQHQQVSRLCENSIILEQMLETHDVFSEMGLTGLLRCMGFCEDSPSI